jgi:class 3 adenylate cyclase
MFELSDIQIAVGIATGSVVAGNIGSLERMEYTCIGDTVNTAARLEKLNREIGTNIILCERTFKAVKQVVVAHRLPPMKLKGERSRVLYALEVPEDISPLIARLEKEMERPEAALLDESTLVAPPSDEAK